MHIKSVKKYILGFCYSHDAGACIIDDSGQIIACINEERIRRIKQSSDFPSLSIKECLKIGGLKPKDISLVAVGGKMAAPLQDTMGQGSHLYNIASYLSLLGITKVITGNKFFCFLLKIFFCNKYLPIFNSEKIIKKNLKKNWYCY